MSKKIVKIDVHEAVSRTSSTHFGVHMLARMREAEIPVIGSIYPIGVRYGTLTMRTDYDLDNGDHFIIEWSAKRGEKDPGVSFEDLFSGPPATEE